MMIAPLTVMNRRTVTNHPAGPPGHTVRIDHALGMSPVADIKNVVTTAKVRKTVRVIPQEITDLVPGVTSPLDVAAAKSSLDRMMIIEISCGSYYCRTNGDSSPIHWIL